MLQQNPVGSNRIEVAERRKEFQRARQQAFTVKQLQQTSGASVEDAREKLEFVFLERVEDAERRARHLLEARVP